MVAVTSQDENAFLVNTCTNLSYNYAYIGAFRTSSGSYEWVNEDLMTYTNWGAGQPDFQRECVFLRKSDGKWYTSDCSISFAFICKKPLPVV